MRIKPLFDRVLIEEVGVKEKTSGGIFIPESAQEKPQLAIVVAVGNGNLIDGKEIKSQIKVGDKIIYSKFSGVECRFENKDYIIIRQADILAVIKEVKDE